MKKISLILVTLLLTVSAWAWVPERRVLGDEAMRLSGEEVMARKSVQAVQAVQSVGTERRIIERVPVIMVNYADMALRVPRQDIDSMFMAQNYNLNGATGSVRQYFNDQSMGQYNPQFDIYGPVTVSHNYAYYGAASGRNDVRPGDLVLEACALMDDSLDFSLYDADGNGQVDLVFVLYAGPGQNDQSVISTSWIPTPSDVIWPHYWTIVQSGSSLPKTFDGKTIDSYEVSAELDGYLSNASVAHICGIGLACHEFGHALGLVDIYYQGHSTKTLGIWDIMDYGIYLNDLMTPPNYSAYERWFMGWLDPVLLSSPCDVTLHPLGTHNEAYIVSANGTKPSNIISPNPSTFYLIENRQRAGWDSYVPGHGMLITKINWSYGKWSGNTVNTESNNMGVDILEADGQAPSYNPNNTSNGYLGKQGDCFPTATVNSWTLLSDYPITNIVETDGVISFSFMGGGTGTNTINQNADVDINGYKVLRHGRMVIVRHGKEYDILGNTL